MLVQELAAIEGLARVDVVCTDKTGTLTELDLEVAEVVPLGGATPARCTAALGALAAADPEPNASGRALAAAFPPPGVDADVAGGVLVGPPLVGRPGSAGEGDWIMGAPNVLLEAAGAGDPGDRPTAAAPGAPGGRARRRPVRARAGGCC